MAVQQHTYTVEEFLEIAQSPEFEDKQLELIDGELIIMPPSSGLNSEIAALIGSFILGYVRSHKLGRVTGADGAYKLDSRTTLVPDAAFVAYSRGLDFSGFAVNGAPDLVVEVISPELTAEVFHTKVWAYFRAGTQVLWVVYPLSKEVDVYRPLARNRLEFKKSDLDGILDGGDALPGFTLPVKDIFPSE